MTEASRNSADPRFWQNCEFLTSGARPEDLPAVAREVAFAGRSNAGKSSALNALTGRSGLARTSKTPGRTQLVNLFRLHDDAYLADLPGYGFAKAPRDVQRRWAALVERYFSERKELIAVVVIVDIRRGLTDLDRQLLQWVLPTGRAIHVLLTKADKLSRGAGKIELFKVQKELRAMDPFASAQLFSAKSRDGVPEAREQIARFLDDPDGPESARNGIVE